MNKLLIILGPTSTGKTDLALKLAKKINGELIACDSRQVYMGLDIGTGKYPSVKRKVQSVKCKVNKGKGYWEMDGVKIWMYDVADPKKQYTIFDYVKDAREVIGDIRERGKLPIIVGGTGFYLRALLEGLPNLTIPPDPKLRVQLEKLSLQQLQKKLQELSPDKWEKMNSSDRQNPRRLIRAIELSAMSLRGRSEATDVAIYTKQDSHGPPEAGLGMTRGFIGSHADILKIGLIAPRHILYQRIDERVVSRIDQGMIDEARKLHKDGLSFKRMRQLGLEYGVLADYLSGRIRGIKGNQGLVKIMQSKIHGFARRQITWFKKTCPPAGREKDVFWFDIVGRNFPSNVEKVITKWYYQPADVTKD